MVSPSLLEGVFQAFPPAIAKVIQIGLELGKVELRQHEQVIHVVINFRAGDCLPHEILEQISANRIGGNERLHQLFELFDPQGVQLSALADLSLD
ncbi:hypothetical protein D3C86_1804170 [compost metagenome]